MTKQKLIIFSALILVFILLVSQTSNISDLADLQARIASFREWQSQNSLLFIIGFFALYVIATAFSLPIAVPMALAAGALFGFWKGLLIGSFASTIGATLSFLSARYLLRESLEKRFSAMLDSINKGIERDGAFYLFTLRLIPLFPFFAINLVMGLTKMRVGLFYIVSQLGMLPGSAAFIYAGTQLSTLTSIGDILSPKLIFSFAILGLLPWIGKAIVGFVKRRRIYANWQKPKHFDRNMVVIGGGAAGLVSAYIASAVKAKVTLVESHKMGGDCLNYGCVPSKALIASARIAHDIERADHYGVKVEKAAIDFPKVMARVAQVIKDIEPHDSVDRYEGLGVDVVEGYAKIISPWEVEIDQNDGRKTRLTTRSIVLATGAAPFVPPIDGIETTRYLTSDTLWETLSTLKAAPKSMVILGGGPIGSELAQALSRLGTKVTLIELADRLLPREDEDLSAAMLDALTSSGVDVKLGHKAVKFDGNRLECEVGEGRVTFDFDLVLLAIGRAARLRGYGLEELGIETSRVIETNEYLETIYPNIFAAGDVAGPFQFTHTASHQAWYAAVNALFGRFKKFKVDYRVIPWAIFTDPEIARVGLSENEAKEKGIAYDVTRYEIDDLDRAIADGQTKGFVKVLTVKGGDKILGASIVGYHAGELIAEFVLAMKHKIGLNKLLSTIHIYPTMMEANKYAAGNWKRSTTQQGTLKLLEKFHSWSRGKAK